MRAWCLSFIAVVTLAKGQTLDSGLVFCLPINNSVVDEVSDRVITSFGYSLTRDRSGHNSQAIMFNGSTDYIEVDGFGYVLPEREITISFWAKTEEVKPHFVCVMMPNDPNNRLSIVINYWHSGYKYHFWDVQNTSEGRLGVTPIYEDTDWHFYAFTNSYNNGEMRAYKDGVLMERKYAQVSTYQGNRNLRIGKGDIPGSNFHGSIDEFRIYDRVLTEEEIKLLQSADGCSLTSDTTQNNGTRPCGYGGFEV
jgi:hypothetical protein